MWLALSIGGLAWVVSLALAYLLGYKSQKLTARINGIEVQLTDMMSRKQDVPVKPEVKSSIIDPTDLAQRAQWEADELQKKLNP